MRLLLFFILLFAQAVTSMQPLKAYEQRDWLQKQASQETLAAMLQPVSQWAPLPNYADREACQRAFGDTRQQYIRRGEQHLSYQWQVVTASMYLEFERSGNRTVMERPASANEQALTDLFMAEMAEGEGRFMPALIDGIWYHLEMTSWALSAHLIQQKGRRALPDYRQHVVDLGAIKLAEALSWIWYYLHDEIDKVDPSISERMCYEMDRRIITPFFEQYFNWMAFRAKPTSVVNNWTPWCNAAVLQCLLLMEPDAKRKAAGVWRTMQSVDVFLNHTGSDGCCDEGTSYWPHAAGKLLDYMQVLTAATGGRITLGQYQLVRDMGEYISRSYVGNGWTVNFADASAKSSTDPFLVYRYGQFVNSDELRHFARALYTGSPSFSTDLYRMMTALQVRNQLAATEPALSQVPATFYPNTQVCYMRSPENGLMVAVKGGHNNESHNHNDVGTFSLYCQNQPVIIDAGVGTYTRQTFSRERYTIWTMQSLYHNVPCIQGVAQREGMDYHAGDVRFDRKSMTFSADLSTAYPKEACVDKWTRTLSMKGGSVVLTDSYMLSELKPGVPNTLHLMVWKEPVISQTGLVRLPLEQGSVEIRYDAGRFSCIVEPIPLTDSRLSRVWGKRIYRLVFTDKKPAIKGKYTFAVKTSAEEIFNSRAEPSVM